VHTTLELPRAAVRGVGQAGKNHGGPILGEFGILPSAVMSRIGGRPYRRERLGSVGDGELGDRALEYASHATEANDEHVTPVGQLQHGIRNIVLAI